jgi:hypothetical protein
VKIINLGLEPEEGYAMGLPPEVVKRGKKRKPVAAYVSEEWARWLQTNRIELNAMTTPVLLEWLDQKMEEFGQGKIIPPQQVMTEFLTQTLRGALETLVRDRILRDAGFAKQVEAAAQRLEPDVLSRSNGLDDLVRASLAADSALSWRAPVEQLVAEMVKGFKE